MVFDVGINGRSVRVTVDRAGESGPFLTTIDGRRRTVDCVRIDPETLSLIVLEGGVDGDAQRNPPLAVYDVGIAAGRRQGELAVSVHGRAYSATLSKPAARRENRGPGPERHAIATGRQHICAPMPGRIVRVLVAPGDRVSARQGVVVVEAMKMENELRSPQDGVVREVMVHEGASVDAGTILVTVE